jgi:inner membrane protein
LSRLPVHNTNLDPLTHTLTGLYLKRAVLGRQIPRAGLFMMLAANVPDIDVVTLAWGSAAVLHWHRHFTHSALFAPVLAIAFTGLFRLTCRGPFPWLAAWLAATVAIFSHIVLDLTNVYGIHALWPARTDWMHWDITPVIDFWIWTILLLSLFAPLLGKLVGSEISSGKRPTRQFGRGWAIAGLCLLLSYESARAVLHSQAIDILEARLYADAAPWRTAAYPSGSSLTVWRGVVESAQAMYFYNLDVTKPFHPFDATPVPKDGPDDLLPQLQANAEFREFIAFNQAPLWQRTPSTAMPGAEQIRLLDLRFGGPAEPSFACQAVIVGPRRVRDIRCSFGSGARSLESGDPR